MNKQNSQFLAAGRKWHAQLHKSHPNMVPHELPTLQALDDVIHDLPFTVQSYVDEEEFYNAVLAIPPQFSFGGAPIRLQVRVHCTNTLQFFWYHFQ